jgi:hypothetical protein
MPWCAIIWKAIKFRRALSRLKQAKKNAYRESLGLPPVYPLYERPVRWVGEKLKTLVLKTCCRCCDRKKGKKITLWDKIWMKDTYPNLLLKCIGGIVGN